MTTPSRQLDGAWRMQRRTRDGTSWDLAGVLLFTPGRWSTLYFLPGQTGQDHWASAEAGRYELDGDTLTFHHEFTFQGGAGRELVINLASQVVEVCHIALTDKSLEIQFPSGSLIRCARLPR